MRSLLLWSSSVAMAVVLGSCAGTECNFHSQCEYGYYCQANSCRQDCQIDEDCGGGQVCNGRIGRCEMPDGAVPPPDGGTARDAWTPPADAGRDGWTPPVDAGRDAWTPPVDSGGTTGTGRYLDRCTDDADCASGLCVPDVGGSRFCSRACTSHAVCADEHVCDGATCVPDDTGRPCAAAATCNLGLCVGAAGAGSGKCTRPCADATDCPAGYACADAGGGAFVCVDIEKPCSAPTDCATGLCLSVQGCTSACRTASDCPARLPGLPAYTCEIAFGSSSPICVPPDDVIGADAAGAVCRYDGSGLSLCRSGACDDGAPTGPMCTQACTAEGGCGPGLGCFPLADGGEILLVCSRAGTGALGEACASGRECDSGLCDATSSRCTRFCDDGLCPTGWTCEPVAGFGVNLCRP